MTAAATKGGHGLRHSGVGQSLASGQVVRAESHPGRGAGCAGHARLPPGVDAVVLTAGGEHATLHAAFCLGEGGGHHANALIQLETPRRGGSARRHAPHSRKVELAQPAAACGGRHAPEHSPTARGPQSPAAHGGAHKRLVHAGPTRGITGCAGCCCGGAYWPAPAGAPAWLTR
jgi:hypothetical protein